MILILIGVVVIFLVSCAASDSPHVTVTNQGPSGAHSVKAIDIFRRAKRRIEALQDEGRKIPVTICYAQTLDGSMYDASLLRALYQL